MDRIEPWGEGEDRQLSWFSLTDGAYCIETTAGRLLELDSICEEDLDVPWLGYVVVRLFEDIEEIWQYVREPVPSDILVRYFAWRSGEEAWLDANTDALWDTYMAATHWWSERDIGFDYLQEPPSLHLWRSESAAHLEWSGSGP